MITKLEHFKTATDSIDKIISSPNEATVDVILEEVKSEIQPNSSLRDVLLHMNTLLLNVILNRRELGIAPIERAEYARRKINLTIQNL